MTDTDRLEVVQGGDGQFYWHRQAANGRLISSGGEGFTRKPDAWRAAYRANTDLDPNQDPEVFGGEPG